MGNKMYGMSFEGEDLCGINLYWLLKDNMT